jgi:formate dehydrogenase major subunit
MGIRAALRRWPLIQQVQGIGQIPLSEVGLGPEAISDRTRQLAGRVKDADRVVASVCPYCAVGCGQLIYVKNEQVIDIEGDPRSPINQGTLCPKGAATYQLTVNPDRWTMVKYRAPYSDRWEDRPLDWAMERIAQLVKQTRDQTYVEVVPQGSPDFPQNTWGKRVNQCTGIASLGGATLDNEENYLIKKLFTGGLGLVWVENQARV